MTKQFKTHRKYGYQPVVLPAEKWATALIELYIRVYRPVAIANSDDLACTYLFVTFKKGQPYKRAALGKMVSSAMLMLLNNSVFDIKFSYITMCTN